MHLCVSRDCAFLQHSSDGPCNCYRLYSLRDNNWIFIRKILYVIIKYVGPFLTIKNFLSFHILRIRSGPTWLPVQCVENLFPGVRCWPPRTIQCRGYERRELLSVPSTCQCISTQKYLSWRVLFLNVEISGFMTIWLSVKLLHILMALKYKKNISVTFKIDTVL